MQEQFLEGKPILHAAGQNNTGDGIRMAQRLGAGLWHMWHVHGLAAAIRDEPGNVSFTVHRARDDTRDIFLHEVYKSEEAFKAHREMQHFKTFVLQRAVPLLEQREIRMWSVADDI